jgi:polyisoprenoid-binding protein YceI
MRCRGKHPAFTGLGYDQAMAIAPRSRVAPPRRALVALLALAGLVGAAQAQVRSYSLDPVHTRLAFQVSHAGFSNPIGSFSGIHGNLEFDPADWSSARLDVRIPVKSLDLGDAHWQQKVLDRTFFDAGRFPEAHFVATGAEAAGDHRARVHGQLTLHGVTAPVTLEVTFNQLKRHPLTLKKTAGFSATAVLSRKAFGIDAWKSVVGDEVKLIIEAEATRSHADEADQPDAAEPAAPAAPPADSVPPPPPEPPHAAAQ